MVPPHPPRHRGGDAETGVTIMQMDAGLDTGDMLLAERLPIAPSDTTATCTTAWPRWAGGMIVEALELAACGGLTAVPQPADGITYAHKIEKAEHHRLDTARRSHCPAHSRVRSLPRQHRVQGRNDQNLAL